MIRQLFVTANGMEFIWDNSSRRHLTIGHEKNNIFNFLKIAIRRSAKGTFQRPI